MTWQCGALDSEIFSTLTQAQLSETLALGAPAAKSGTALEVNESPQPTPCLPRGHGPQRRHRSALVRRKCSGSHGNTCIMVGSLVMEWGSEDQIESVDVKKWKSSDKAGLVRSTRMAIVDQGWVCMKVKHREALMSWKDSTRVPLVGREWVVGSRMYTLHLL